MTVSRVARMACLGIVLLAMWSGSASATILVKMTLDELINSSDVVFRGQVVSSSVAMGDDGMPWTTYSFADVEVLAGDYNGDTFNVLCAGGDLDGVVTEVVGTPHFEIGDRIIGFYSSGDPLCQFVGWEQGILRVVSENGQDIILNDRGVAVTGIGGSDIALGEQHRRGVRPARGNALIVGYAQATGIRNDIVMRDGNLDSSAGDRLVEQLGNGRTQPLPAMRAADFSQAIKTFSAQHRKRAWTPAKPADKAVGRANALGLKEEKAKSQGGKP